MSHSREHLRRQAERHAEAHQELKGLLNRLPPKEKVWRLFLGTFLVTILGLGIYSNTDWIGEKMTPVKAPALPVVHGFQNGTLSSLKINRQANIAYERILQKIPTQGGAMGARLASVIANTKSKPIETTLVSKSALATRIIAHYQATPPPLVSQNAIRTSAWMAGYLGNGQNLTPVQKTDNLQKSIVTTYYVGDKTPDLNSTLANDTRLLQNIKDTLSVDLFQYLNQGKNRADSLNEYLRLLNALNEKTKERINELRATVSLLAGNAKDLGTKMDADEKIFFQELDKLEGAMAEENLSKFIGLRKEESEVRAKWGAYQKLYAYYQLFQPRLENLIKEIQLNREALIAGVKVIEIQNMQLPLVIREKK